jgi:hypothetical protein
MCREPHIIRPTDSSNCILGSVVSHDLAVRGVIPVRGRPCRLRIATATGTRIPGHLPRKPNSGPQSSFCRLIKLPHPVAVLENLARFGPVGGTDDAILLHEVDEPRGAAIAYAKAAL